MDSKFYAGKKPLETFRFEDKNDYEYEISFKVLSKNRHPGILHCTFFPQIS